MSRVFVAEETALDRKVVIKWSGRRPQRRSRRVQRYHGYGRAVAEHGREMDQSIVVKGTFRYESGRDAMHRLLALDNHPDAVLATT